MSNNTQYDKWHVGAMNDALFIINRAPSPSNDDVWHDNPNGPTVILKAEGLSLEDAQAICDAHNTRLSVPVATEAEQSEYSISGNRLIKTSLIELHGCENKVPSHKTVAIIDDEIEAKAILKAMQAKPEADRVADIDYSDMSREQLEQHARRMSHDYSKLAAFFSKHGLGSKVPMSCFSCGCVKEPAIKHLELPDIYVCVDCNAALRAQLQGEPVGELSVDHHGFGSYKKLKDLPVGYYKLFTHAQPANNASVVEYALNVQHPDCHKAADAFWQYWKENGATHKHGYYESTWGAINQAILYAGVKPHEYLRPRIEVKGTTLLGEIDSITPQGNNASVDELVKENESLLYALKALKEESMKHPSMNHYKLDSLGVLVNTSIRNAEALAKHRKEG